MKTCVTHHHACDCREEKFRKMEAALAEARKGLELLAGVEERGKELAATLRELKMYGKLSAREGMAHLARTTLSGIDAILSEDERE